MSTKLSYSQWIAVLNPSKSFLALKKTTLEFWRLLKDHSLYKNTGKTPNSHIVDSLRGEYCWTVKDSELIRLLKSPKSLNVYILMLNVYITIGIHLILVKAMWPRISKWLSLFSLSNHCPCLKVWMGWWLLRLSAKVLAFLQLSVNFFSYG